MYFFQSPRHTDSDSSDSPSDTEAPPTLTPTATFLNNHRHHNHHHHHHRNNMTTVENIAAIAVAAGLNPSSTVSHIPFYSPALIQSQWYMPGAPRNFHSDRPDTEKSGEQPLDLTISSKSLNNNNSNSIDNKTPLNRLPTLDTRHVFK